MEFIRYCLKKAQFTIILYICKLNLILLGHEIFYSILKVVFNKVTKNFQKFRNHE